MSITKNNTRMLEGEDLTLTGKLGIGTSSPSAELDVQGAGNSRIQVKNTSVTGEAQFHHDGNGDLYIKNSVSGRNQIFFNDGAERMRIDSTGKILIARATSAEDCRMDISHGTSWGLVLDGDGSGTDNHIMFSRSGGTRGYITSSSSSVSYNTSSDYRLKENVVDLTGASARVNQLNPSRFNFIVDADKTVDGFLAHEVATVVPEAITGTKDAVDADGNPEYQGIDQSKLVPLLTAALQEALTEIASLKTRVEALEA